MSWGSAAGTGASTASTVGSTAGTVGSTAGTAAPAASTGGFTMPASVQTTGGMGNMGGNASMRASEGGMGFPQDASDWQAGMSKITSPQSSATQPSPLERFQAGADSNMRTMMSQKKFGNNPETYGYLTRQAIDNAPPVRSQPLQQQEQGGGFRIQTPVRRYGRY